MQVRYSVVGWLSSGCILLKGKDRLPTMRSSRKPSLVGKLSRRVSTREVKIEACSWVVGESEEFEADWARLIGDNKWISWENPLTSVRLVFRRREDEDELNIIYGSMLDLMIYYVFISIKQLSINWWSHLQLICRSSGQNGYICCLTRFFVNKCETMGTNVLQFTTAKLVNCLSFLFFDLGDRRTIRRKSFMSFLSSHCRLLSPQ